MDFLRRLFGLGKPKQPATPPARGGDHSVQVTLRLGDDRFGSRDEFDEVTALGDELEALVVAAAVGEFDGNEMGGGKCVLFFYGPDADRLFAAIEPALRASPLARGARVCKRHGSSGAREEIVELPG